MLDFVPQIAGLLKRQGYMYSSLMVILCFYSTNQHLVMDFCLIHTEIFLPVFNNLNQEPKIIFSSLIMLKLYIQINHNSTNFNKSHNKSALTSFDHHVITQAWKLKSKQETISYQYGTNQTNCNNTLCRKFSSMYTKCLRFNSI